MENYFERKKLMLGALFFLAIGFVFGQDDTKVIEVSFDKSVLIVFGDGQDDKNWIDNFHVGNKTVVGGHKSENTLIVQALEEDFPETNLIVKLKSGKLLVYILRYNNTPSKLRIVEPLVSAVNWSAVDNTVKPVYVVDEKITEKKNDQSPRHEGKKEAVNNNEVREEKNSLVGTGKVVGELGTNIIEENGMLRPRTIPKDFLFDLWDMNYSMRVSLSGIYADGNGRFFYKINIDNRSASDFPIGLLDLYVKDSHKNMKHKVSHDTRLEQFNIYNQWVVKSGTKQTIWAVSAPVSLEKGKELILSVWEAAPGERKFLFSIGDDALYSAKRF